MDKRIQCPVCGKEGVLQWKETITKAKGKTYRYKKLYVYHWNPKKPKWCYLRKEHLEALGISKNDLTQKRNILTQNSIDSEKPKMSSKSQTKRAGSLARTGHEPPKLGVAGSNPVPPARFRGKKLEFLGTVTHLPTSFRSCTS